MMFALLAALLPQPAWADDGFAGAGGRLAGVRVQGDGALVLESDLSKLVLLCDPSKYDVIGDMTVFRGRLFASSSFRLAGPKMYSANAEILEAAPTGEWKVAQEIRSTMLLNLRPAGDRLLFAYFSGRTDWVGSFDGTEWGTLGALPQHMLHGMDVCGYKEKLYWSGALRDAASATGGVGVVYESADGGKTWKEVFRDTESGRIQDMVVLKDRLYANRRGASLLSWDGTAWKDIPVELPIKTADKIFLGDGLLAVHKDAILAASAPLYYRFNGEKWTSHTPGYLRMFVDGDRVLGLRSDGHVYQSEDGTSWKKLTERGVPPEEFGPSKNHTLRRGSVALHGGRLFVGTGLEGKIYASPLSTTGTYTARVRPVAGGAKLTWDADVPRGATLAFSVRTAPSEKGFADSEWRPADGAVAVPAGHKFLQYRAAFASDGAVTPVLKSVRWEP